MLNIQACDEQTDTEGYCSCSRTILSWLRHYEQRGARWSELHERQKARAERAEAALREIVRISEPPKFESNFRLFVSIAREALGEGT